MISIVGAGWLGLPLGAALVSSGYRVVGTTTSENKLALIQENGMEAHLLDVQTATIAELELIMQGEILIVTIPPRGGGDNYRSMLDSLRDSAIANPVKKIIYTSATSVYPANNQEVNEKDAILIRSPHSGVQLLEMEDIFRKADELHTTIIRFGGLFGPGRHPGKWLAGRTDVAGADSPVNMIHLDDCIGVISAVIRKNAWGRTYNATSPQHPSRELFYQSACTALGLEPPRWNQQSKPWKKVSSQKIIDELGYLFTYPDPRQAFPPIL
ncbi:MAG: SDR family oxidoreductase [Bacteroidota bacterium]